MINSVPEDSITSPDPIFEEFAIDRVPEVIFVVP